MTNQNSKYKIGTAALVLAAAGLFFNGNYGGTKAYSNISNTQNNGIDKILEMSTAYANASESKGLEAKVMGTETKTITEPDAEDTKYAEAEAEDSSIDYMKYVTAAKGYENEGKYEQAIGAYLEAAKRLESKDAKIVDYTDSKYSKDGIKGDKLNEQMKCYLNVAKNYNQIKNYKNALKYGNMAKMLDSIRYSDNPEINSEIDKAKKELGKSRDISMVKN